MALHPEFPKSPYSELLPDQRWFPAAEELRSTAYEKLLPPMVANIRTEVAAWRDSSYAGASDTSRALLNWWFETEHLVKRVWEHKQDVVAGFTRTYHVHNLVYFEQHEDMHQAIQREKNIKKWSRAWKIELIEKTNSAWQDLWSGIC